MLYIIPFAVILISFLAGFVALNRQRPDVFIGLAALLAGVSLWALWKEAQEPHLDAILYALLAYFVVLPGLVAAGAGAALGYLRAAVRAG